MTKSAAALLLPVLSALALTACVDRLAFFPPGGDGFAEGMEMIPAGEERIAIVYLPPPDDKAPVVLFSHGSGQDLSSTISKLRVYSYSGNERLGYRYPAYGALGYDYEGYGASTGSPSEEAAYRDAEAAFRHLVEDRGIAPDRIVSIGFSLGSGPACRIAARHPVKALVLCAPMASGRQSLHPLLSWPLQLFPDFFPNLETIASVRCPVLILHGEEDSVFPISRGRALYEAANEPKFFVSVKGGRHIELVSDYGERKYRDLLHSFLSGDWDRVREFVREAESAAEAER